MSKGLSLDISIDKSKFSLERTYRDEGLSVGADHMRLFGEDIQMDVSYNELLLGERLGSGACSTVNIAKHKKTSELFAVKLFNINDKDQASQLYREIKLLASVECDCLISLKGAFHDQGSIGIIIEFMDKGSLEFLLENDVEVGEQVLAAIVFQMVWGLGYLHYEGRLHRDIKPANVLMNTLGQVKLSDFGISKELDSSTAMSHTSVGTFRYMSPERLLGEKYDASGDIWSLGITIIELWTKKYPFSGVADTPIELISEFENGQIDKAYPRSVFPREMRNVVKSMLQFYPERRATCPQLATDPWFEVCGINNLNDAQMIVGRWIALNEKRLLMSLSMSSSGMASSLNGSIHRLDKQPKNNQRVHHDKPIKKDINEMSISYGEQSWNGVGSNSISSQHSRYTSGMNLRNSRNGAFQGMQLEEDIYEDDFDTYDTKQDTKYSDSRVKRGK